MTDNTAIWEALGKTDPSHTKAFNRAGGFKGTAIKPQWVLQRLTEQFGPCGVGWGVFEPTFQVVPAGNETLVYCTVRCWHGETTQQLVGVGGDKVSASRSNGPFNDDEAFKKAFTDAVMNAFKFIGVGADVHMGRFDDSKYVEEARREFNGEGAGQRGADTQPAPRAAPANGLGTEPRDTGPGGVNGKDWWGAAGPGLSPAAAKRDAKLCEAFESARSALRSAQDEAEWKAACRDHSAAIMTMPKAWRTNLRDEADTEGARLNIFQSERNAA